MTNSRGHWLPFAAEKATPVTPCDLAGYFVIVNNDKCDTATFRGRNLCGVDLDLGKDFSCVLELPDEDRRRVHSLTVWNHDDVPLKSDVAQQAINLARVQNFLGSSSGIEYFDRFW